MSRILLFLLMLLAIGCTASKQKPVIDFDIQGLRIGDPIPERLLAKIDAKDIGKQFIEVNEHVKDPDMSVTYTFIDSKLEGVHITFDTVGTSGIVNAYTEKFGAAPTWTKDDERWATKHGEYADFVINRRLNTGEIQSDKYREYYEKLNAADAKATSKKL